MTETPEPRRMTRAELAAAHGLHVGTLARWYAKRDSNGHPLGRRNGKNLEWDAAEWAEWHRREHQQDPNLVNVTEFMKILGHKDHAWVSKAANVPPPGFPEPVEWDDPENRRGPKWRRSEAQAFADNREERTAPPGAGRRAGSRAGTRYANDERLTAALKSLTDHPDDRLARHIERLHQLLPGTSPSGWTQILKAARDQIAEAQAEPHQQA
ncbi:hypothetical protein [Streptomyces sp. NPDC001568]|uniref:hypothetical protein n=1 Tax=Streptomyces sp. NPDC001568 TaxID=3364588 RepID=UPI0036CFED0E